MSQPTPSLATAPSPVPVGAPTPAEVSPAAAPALPATSSTPRRLRLLLLGVVLGGVLFGLAGLVTFAGQTRNLNRAEAAATQLIRVQQIQTNLLRADATATNAFLVGGLEPSIQRATYDDAVAAVGSLVAEAAQAQPADAVALSALNRAVVSYTGAVEQARANNRQGFPVGAQYLRTASTELRTVALPILDNLVAASTERAEAAMDTPAPAVVFALVGVVVAAGLVAALVFLARTFHRRLNIGVLAAAVVVLVALVAGTLGLIRTNSGVNELESGAYRELTQTATARIEANDAKANESLTLIARGSGGAFEKAWQASAGTVDSLVAASAEPQLAQRWRAYVGVHTEIRGLDDAGRWDAAVARATGTAGDSANTRFGSFDDSAAAYVDAMGGQTRDGLQRPRTGLIAGAVLTLLAGIAAALLGRWGVALRLREYR